MPHADTGVGLSWQMQISSRLFLNWSVENETHVHIWGIIVCSTSKVEFHREHAFHRFVPEFLSLWMFARKQQQIKRGAAAVHLGSEPSGGIHRAKLLSRQFFRNNF
jgi:hypothetical protein